MQKITSNNSEVLFFEIGIDGNIVYCNDRAASWLCTSKADLIDKVFVEAASKFLDKPGVERIILAFQERENIEFGLSALDGTCFDASLVSFNGSLNLILTKSVIQGWSEANNVALLQSVIDSSSNLLSVFAPVYDKGMLLVDFQCILTNPAHRNFRKKNMSGKFLLKEYPEIDSEDLFRRFSNVMDSDKSEDAEIFYSSNGNDFWFRTRIIKMPFGLLVASEEITERKKTELELKENRSLLQSVLDSSLIQMSVLHAQFDDIGKIEDFRIVMVNKELERETGRTDLPGKLYLQEYPGIKAAGLFDKMVEVMESGEPRQIEYFYEHENFNKWFSCMFVKIDDGIVASNLDISSRKNYEEALFKNFTLLNHSEKWAKTGSWEFEIKNNQFKWSEGMYKLFGIKLGTQIGFETFVENVIDDDRIVAEDFLNNFRTFFQNREHVLRIRVFNTIRTQKIGSIVKYDADGNPTHILGVNMDISELVDSEQKLIDLNQSLNERNNILEIKNNELASFAFIASHDLKEPLRKMIFFSNWLVGSKDFSGLSEKSQYYLDRIRSSAERMSMLVDDLLALSKLQVIKNDFQKVNLNSILQICIEELKEEIEEKKALISSDKLPFITGSESHLVYLFNNLIRNALKFHSPGMPPKLIISSYVIDGLKINHPLSIPGKQYNAISFQDSGIGFDNTFSEKIFKIFERLNTKEQYPGSGIGLAICKKIMDNHNGIICGESVNHKGANFNCFFPLDYRNEM